MYIDEPIRTKQAFRQAVEDGETLHVVREEHHTTVMEDGECNIRAQSPFTWRARVRIESGVVVEVLQ